MKKSSKFVFTLQVSPLFSKIIRKTINAPNARNIGQFTQNREKGNSINTQNKDLSQKKIAIIPYHTQVKEM